MTVCIVNYLLLVLSFAQVSVIVGNVGDPYGLLNPTQTECEFQALTLGSRLSDAFNSYDERTPFYRRFSHEAEENNKIFHRIMMLEMERRHLPGYTKENNLKKEEKIHKYHHHHHLHSNSSGHAFHGLVNKAVHLVGDYTLFPVFTSLLLPMHAHSPSNEIERMIIDLCPTSTASADSSIDDLAAKSKLNLACNGYGHDGSLSFHLANHMLESNELKQIEDLYTVGEQARSPDVLFVQLGHFACLLPFNGSTGHDQLVGKTEGNVKQFMSNLHDLVRKKHAQVNTTVIISLSSRSLLPTPQADYCTWRLNRMIAYEAHVKGFIALEREEIEMRLLFRSERSPEPMKAGKALLAFPGSQIVAASFVSLLNCLKENIMFALL